VPEQPVTVSLARAPKAATVHRLETDGSLSSRAAARGTSIALSVPDRVVIVELTMPGAGTGSSGNRPPRLTKVRLTRRVVRQGRSTRLRYRLSEPATVSAVITRKGHRRPVLRVRGHRRAGRRSTYLPGRVQGRALRLGRYLVRVRARDALGARSGVRVVRFRVVRRR
jgi:hypothetical protein